MKTECPACGETFKNRSELRGHQRNSVCITLPDGVTADDLEQMASEFDTILEIQQEIRYASRKGVKLLLSRHGLSDQFDVRLSPEQRVANAGLEIADPDRNPRRGNTHE